MLQFASHVVVTQRWVRVAQCARPAATHWLLLSLTDALLPCSAAATASSTAPLLLLPLLQDIAFEAGLEISAHILAVLPAAVIGLISGVLGIGFVLLNIKISRLRDVLLSRFKWRRCIEPCVLVVVYVTGTMLLPRLFPCTPTHCVTYNHEVYCNIQNLTAAAEGLAPPPNTPPLQLPLYTCSIVSADTNQSWIPSSGTITPDTPTNASAIVYYNELATLMLNTGREEGGSTWLQAVAGQCRTTH